MTNDVLAQITHESYDLLTPRAIYDDACLGVDDDGRPIYVFAELCDLILEEDPTIEHHEIPQEIWSKVNALGDRAPILLHLKETV